MVNLLEDTKPNTRHEDLTSPNNTSRTTFAWPQVRVCK